MGGGDLAERICSLCDELVGQQEEKLRRLGRRLCPDISLDDLYCPDDVPRLREDPLFIYEHGLLAGLSAAAAAARALIRDLETPQPRPGEDPGLPGGPGRRAGTPSESSSCRGGPGRAGA